MSNKVFFYPESKFGGYTDIDGTFAFYTRVNSLLHPKQTALDIGCGRGEYQDDPVPERGSLRIFNNKVKKTIGIDVDPAAVNNPFIDEFHLIEESASWPIKENSIDIIITDWVIEHISDPDHFFSEVDRVLKPGGFFCARTTNQWHYFAIAAALIPNKLHSKILEFAQKNRHEEDVFPTTYKCNTKSKLKRRLNALEYKNVVYNHEAEPSYLEFSKIFYFFGTIYQKFAPNFMKAAIFVFAQKNG